MGSLTPTLVQALAESLQFGSLSKDAAESLAPHLEVRLREIIQDALKFMRHSKRHTLSPDDINSVLIAKSKEVCSASSPCANSSHNEERCPARETPISVHILRSAYWRFNLDFKHGPCANAAHLWLWRQDGGYLCKS